VASQTALGNGTGVGKSTGATGGSRAPGTDKVTTGHQVIEHPRGKNEPRTGENTSAPKAPDPCVLVSRAQAQAIIASPISGETEAPLGPTCIFTLKGQKQSITLTVEQMNVSSQVRLMGHLQRSIVGGHVAYCGTLGRPMLYLALGGTKVLNVTAPCAIADALAAKALPHITA
jgi:hypothetical protein